MTQEEGLWGWGKEVDQVGGGGDSFSAPEEMEKWLSGILLVKRG